METNQLKKLFSSIYGTEIDLIFPKKNNHEDYFKSLFINIINDWRNAAKQKTRLYTNFGIDISGYDTLLYRALEGAFVFSLGEIKASLIGSYVYCNLNFEVDKLKYVNKHGIEYYIQTPEELYNYVLNVKDEDYLEDE